MATSMTDPTPTSSVGTAPTLPGSAGEGRKAKLVRGWHTSAVSTVAVSLAVALVATVVLRAAHVWTDRSTASMLAISPQPSIDCVIEPGATITKSFTVTNTSSSPITLVGSQQSCGCIGSDGLPAQLRPGEATTVSFRISGAGLAPGTSVVQSSHLFTNIKGLTPRFEFNLSAKTVSPPR